MLKQGQFRVSAYFKNFLLFQPIIVFLQEPCSVNEEEGDFISEEEIQRFKANQEAVATKRQELRETLKQRFANLCRHTGKCGSCEEVSNGIKKISL